MEEQPTWRGHTFTLFVFAGIVFLCATFFVLGMLVGRSQGQKYASVSAANVDKLRTPPQGRLDFTYEDLRKDQPPAPTLTAPPSEAVPSEQPAETIREEGSSAPSPVNIQVEALQQSKAAERMVSDLKKLGFSAFVIPPAAGERNAYYRVQVGPYTDAADVESAKQKLEAAGYHNPIIKK
jgi:cell division septation protein DedD